MAELIDLEIITPEGVKLAEKVAELTAPSVSGEFGVLPGHRPLLAALATGIVTYTQGAQTVAVAVGTGFVEVAEDRVLVLTDRFVRKEDLDPVRLRQELKDADEALSAFQGDPDSAEYGVLVSSELWVATKLELYGDPPPPRVSTLSELQLGTHENYSGLAGQPSEGAAPPTSDPNIH